MPLKISLNDSREVIAHVLASDSVPFNFLGADLINVIQAVNQYIPIGMTIASAVLEDSLQVLCALLATIDQGMNLTKEELSLGKGVATIFLGPKRTKMWPYLLYYHPRWT